MKSDLCLGLFFGFLVLAGVCLAEDKNEKGHWGSWSEARPCSVTCGSGTRKIVREWIPGPKAPAEDKVFTSTKEFYCINQDRPHCPKNGTWSGWIAWTDCTKGCGGGTRERKRECVGILYGGEACPGKESVTEKCNPVPCPALPRNFDMTKCIKGTNFTCASNKMCIPKEGRCDKNVQCHDGSDELKCRRRLRPGVGSVRYDLGGGSSSIQGFHSILICSVITLCAILGKRLGPIVCK